LGKTVITPRPIDARANIVDDDLGAALGKQQRMLAPNPACATGYDRNTSFTKPADLRSPSSGSRQHRVCMIGTPWAEDEKALIGSRVTVSRM